MRFFRSLLKKIPPPLVLNLKAVQRGFLKTLSKHLEAEADLCVWKIEDHGRKAVCFNKPSWADQFGHHYFGQATYLYRWIFPYSLNT